MTPEKPARAVRSVVLSRPQRRSFARRLGTNLLVVAGSRIVRLKEHCQMTAAAASPKPKAGKPVTTRHLAAALSEQHQLTKKQGLEMLEDLIGLITKHLK